MADGEVTGDLRELVYLDDNSVNGYLSSLGEGLEVERGESEDTSDQVRGRTFGGFTLPGMFGGGEVEASEMSTESLEKQVEITMPYRLQTLREVIRESGREIKDPSDNNVSLSGGDIIEVRGVVEPMSFFRFELAQSVPITINKANEKLMRVADEVSNDDSNDIDLNLGQNIDDTTDTRINEAFVEVSKILNNDRVPVKLESDETGTYGALLDRDQILIPESRAFSQPRKYRLFGRIDYIVSMNSAWEPTDTLRLAKSYSISDNEIEELSNILLKVANENNMDMSDEHMRIKGPTKVIHPIAMYW
ncbi:hypothetical protein [Halococcus sp. IIIV-5B]|uniref:DUF6414 family protein n=1 Tax=Halococcus sp. IIIV-5B TaxID=2321230 RepID=UPI0011C437D0|nr:hypothetical protein [Halococcus sp. IIIV-5B]